MTNTCTYKWVLVFGGRNTDSYIPFYFSSSSSCCLSLVFIVHCYLGLLPLTTSIPTDLSLPCFRLLWVFVGKPAIRPSQRGGRLVPSVTALTAESTVGHDFVSSSISFSSSACTSFAFWFRSGETVGCDLFNTRWMWEAAHGVSKIRLWLRIRSLRSGKSDLHSTGTLFHDQISSSEGSRNLCPSHKRRWKLWRWFPAAPPVSIFTAMQRRILHRALIWTPAPHLPTEQTSLVFWLINPDSAWDDMS